MQPFRRLALIVLVLAAPQAHTESPETLLRDATLFGRFSTLTASVQMEIHDRGTRQRTLAVHVDQSDPDYRKTLVHVTAPAFLSRLKFLSHATPRAVDRWISTSSGVRRVADSSRDEPVFDSDFTVEDFAPDHSGEYTVRHAGTRMVGSELCDVIEVSPSGPSDGHAMRRVFVSRGDRLLVRAEYYAEDGGLVRVMELQRRLTVDGRSFPGTIVMTTPARRSHTVLTVRTVEVDVPIPSRVFSRGAL